MSDPGSTRLVRAVGLPGLTAISLNGVIGSGIFVLPATVAALLGPASPIAFAVAGLATALVVLCFAEAGSLFEETGGPYVYAREAFGRFVGFEVGWMFLLARLAAAAAISNAFAAYLGYFFPALASGAGRAAAITLLVALLAGLNLAGIRWGAAAVNLLTVAKLAPIALFIGAGLRAVEPAAFQSMAIPDAARLREASLALVFAFGGFENASVPTEEVREPRRNVPIALLLSIGLVLLIYVLVQIVAVGTLPGLAGDPTPLASAARAFLGTSGAAVITVGAILSTSGSTSALMLVGPRILYAFSRGGQLPQALGRIHARYRTPHVAVLAFASATWALALSASFAWLAATSAMARLLFSAATCAAVPILRRKVPASRRAVRLPGGFTVPALACLVCLWLLSGVTPTQAVAGVAALGAGALLCIPFSKTRPASTFGGNR